MRCYECDGCISSFNEYRPDWCNNKKCPQGDKEPEELVKVRKEQLQKLFNTDVIGE